MDDVYVCLEFILSRESYIALLFACLIWTEMMCGLKMFLKGFIVIVVHIFVLLSTQMTRQMEPAKMVKECQVIVEVLFTEVTPRVRQYFSTSFTRCITMLKMVPQLLLMVDSLLSDEHCAPLEANFTESLLMVGFHMLSQTVNIWENLPRLAVLDQA